MPDVDQVKRMALEKLGVLGRGATGEYAMLARLLGEDEEILAAVIGKLEGAGRSFSGRIAVVTGRRILIVGKGFVTRRERVEEIALADVRGARAIPPAKVEVETAAGTRRFRFAGPPPQLVAFADAARGRTSRVEELQELARRKLGRVLAFGAESDLLALALELGEEEAVIDLALVHGKPAGLLALCPEHLVVAPDAERLALASVDAVHAEAEGTLVVRSEAGERRFELRDPERAAVIAQRLAARLRPTG